MTHTPRVPQSSRPKARLVHYYALIGLPNDEVNLKKRTFARRDSGIEIGPIDDIGVISNGEPVPPGYEVIETTPSGLSADLNATSLMGAKPMHFVFSRNESKRPLTGKFPMNSRSLLNCL
jgi:hypothetical protein